jgi:D-alanine-D-alanine ligase-like ATP-grasp enzyme
MITPGPPSVFSLTLLMAQAALSAQLYPGTVDRLPVKNPEVIVDELVKGQGVRFPVIPANPGSSPGQAPESSYFKYLKILWGTMVS